MAQKSNYRPVANLNRTVSGLLSRALIVCSITVIGLGCRPSDQREDLQLLEQNVSEDIGNSEYEVNLEFAPWSEIETEIQAHAGKIVVVDFWSTSCLPCKREFPSLVNLQDRFKEEIVCFAVNVDYIGLPKKSPDSYAPKVIEFLTKRKPAFKCFLSTTSDTDLYPMAGVTSLPTVKVYDADGKLAATIDESKASGDSFTYEADVLPLVESLVKGLQHRNSKSDS